jgi:hypothetical protein
MPCRSSHFAARIRLQVTNFSAIVASAASCEIFRNSCAMSELRVAAAAGRSSAAYPRGRFRRDHCEISAGASDNLWGKENAKDPRKLGFSAGARASPHNRATLPRLANATFGWSPDDRRRERTIHKAAAPRTTPSPPSVALRA